MLLPPDCSKRPHRLPCWPPRAYREDRQAELAQYVAVEANRRGFDVNSKPDQRGYRMQGHLSAEKSPRGTIVVFVWDVTDSIGSGQHRIAGQEIIPASAEGEDPWELVDDTAMSRIAARTAESLAVYLGQKGYFVRHVALAPPDDGRPGHSRSNRWRRCTCANSKCQCCRCIREFACIHQIAADHQSVCADQQSASHSDSRC